MSDNTIFYVKNIRGGFVPATFLQDWKGNFVINPNSSISYSDNSAGIASATSGKGYTLYSAPSDDAPKIDNPLGFLVVPEDKGSAQTFVDDVKYASSLPSASLWEKSELALQQFSGYLTPMAALGTV
ncbi:hypothetical protein [Methylobacterium persicinum]|uniref:Head decoration protein n=1 Tax=Methylobacterium persicinum TaxID=374426 RepID=A0ABU0HPN4_9HYPH|nr:hypothetical protein [Methylobacterium persicinum]MDQ0444261.1 hypothetical protein [Methylobacterium persicinum]